MFINRLLYFLPRNDLKRALGHFNKGDYGKACKDFESYLERVRDGKKPKDQEMVRMYAVESYIEFSKSLASEKKIQEAAQQLEKAIELQPGYADVHYKLGSLYEALGREKDAQECLKNSLKINPNYFRARVMLARSYQRSGERQQAIKELESCLSSAPTFYVDRVKGLLSLAKAGSSAEKLESIFHGLLEERPSSSQVIKQIALESIQNGEYDLAITELKKTLSMNPNYPDLHNLLGIAYANKGMTDDALLEFETSLKIHPDYLKARVNMALTLYEKGSKDESMKHLQVVLKLDPENEVALNLLRELEPVLE